MKSKEFLPLVAAQVGLHPGTCAVYLREVNFKPAGGVKTEKFKGRTNAVNDWGADQVDAAVAAIRKRQEDRANAA